MRTLRLIAAASIATALAGCSLVPASPEPVPSVESWVPAPSPVPVDQAQLDTPYGFAPSERAAYRVRNNGCKAFGTGSGFAIDAHTIVTNHHVIGKPFQIEVTSHDGRDIAVKSSVYSNDADIGIITTVEALDTWVTLDVEDAAVGNVISVSGYPLGDELVVTVGTVLSKSDDVLDAHADFVFELSAAAEPGSSGSAVYDTDGNVVGVLYAADKEEFGNSTYMIPVSILQAILADDAKLKNNKRACK